MNAASSLGWSCAPPNVSIPQRLAYEPCVALPATSSAARAPRSGSSGFRLSPPAGAATAAAFPRRLRPGGNPSRNTTCPRAASALPDPDPDPDPDPPIFRPATREGREQALVHALRRRGFALAAAAFSPRGRLALRGALREPRAPPPPHDPARACASSSRQRA